MRSLPTRMLLSQPRRRHLPGLRPQRGVALIEALVSILIFSFGVLGLVGLEASAINFSVDAQDRNRAAMFASDIASSMWLANSVSYTTNPLLTPQYAAWQTSIADPTHTGLPSGTLNITVSTGASDTGTFPDTADIVITWKPPTDKTGTIRQLTTRVILPTGPIS
jgi:type IV pilus assembly protein PilV